MLFWISLILIIITVLIMTMDYMGKIKIPMAIVPICLIYIIFWTGVHIVMIPTMIYDHTDLHKFELQTQYEQLNQNKNNPYLIEDIIEWNENTLYNQKMQKDFWIGTYIANIYDDYQTIEIE